MKRRDTLRVIPFGIAGISIGAGRLAAQKKPHFPYAPGRPLMELPHPPVAQQPLEYTRRVMDMLKWVRATHSENILEAAYAIARTVEEGRQVWSCWDLGHTNAADIFPGRNGKPEFINTGYESEKVKDGDLVLASFPWPRDYESELPNRDLFVVGAPCPWGGDVKGYENITPEIQKLRIRPYADIWIETNSDHLGAQVRIPGSPSPLGPESGPLCGTIYWMMMADACRILSRNGKTVKVAGDDPVLSGEKVSWISVNDPLMDEYFDEVLRQMELVGVELGAIRNMAGMVADTLLGGGKVYFYSRYSDSLAAEACGRRGGFACARGLWDGSISGLTPKDCVVMGTYKPDDEADLGNLDQFKKSKVRIASIGPVTRDAKVPEGRAVFKETEVHAGRMMDTYGLFALKGCERKVCPTSGILTTAILWEMCAETAYEIIRKTGGNVPAIYFNGALKWASEYNARMAALALERGY